MLSASLKKLISKVIKNTQRKLYNYQRAGFLIDNYSQMPWIINTLF